VFEKFLSVFGKNKKKEYINNGELKISVIMPIYNAEKYLREALDSVINQTLRDIEIICVNDGSKDNSLDIVKEYASKDNRIKIIDKENQGYGATVNRGFSEASGEFVAIFEPDDILDKTIYEKLYIKAYENNLDVIKCNFCNFWTETGKAKRSGLVLRCSKSKPFAPKDNLKMFTCHASVWAGIYRKSFLEKNNIKFLETPGASFQDMSFNFKVLATSPKIMLLKEPLLYYRQDNPNSSINNPGKVFCVCDEYGELTSFLNNNINLKEIFNTQKLVNQYRAYLWNIKRLSNELRQDFLHRFSDEFKSFYNNNEITKEFYKSINKSDFSLLINNPDSFYEKVVLK
jgi:glycosyltransferase involved in cell wall biosynthesis